MGIVVENEIMAMSASAMPLSTGLWGRYLMVLDEVTDRLQRIVGAFESAGVEYALVGGQAVALWVATKDPAAVRTTKDVDILLRGEDLPKRAPPRPASHSITSRCSASACFWSGRISIHARPFI